MQLLFSFAPPPLKAAGMKKTSADGPAMEPAIVDEEVPEFDSPDGDDEDIHGAEEASILFALGMKEVEEANGNGHH